MGWLQSCKSLDELYQIVTSFMKLVLPGTQGQLFIYSNSRDILETTCGWNTADGQDPLTPDDCWALRKGRQYLYDPGDLCFVCDHVADATSPEGEIGKYLCVPIVAHGDTVGLLHLQFGTDNPEVTDAVEFASQCGEHISMAIANVKLRDELQDQSTRDPLTVCITVDTFWMLCGASWQRPPPVKAPLHCCLLMPTGSNSSMMNMAMMLATMSLKCSRKKLVEMTS